MEAEFTIGNTLLGDGCWPQPALRSLALDRGRAVRLHVADPPLRTLYARDRMIELVDEPGGPVLDCNAAFAWCVQRGEYFSRGYFPQVGASLTRDHDIRFRLIGHEVRPREVVAICPFSVTSSEGEKRGYPPNKTMPPDWWADLAARLKPIAPVLISLGSEADPPIAGTTSLRGRPLREAAELIREAQVLITVETWAVVVAGGRPGGGAIYLSSATPPYLTVPDPLPAGSANIHAKFPWLWPMDEVVEAVRRVAGERRSGFDATEWR